MIAADYQLQLLHSVSYLVSFDEYLSQVASAYVKLKEDLWSFLLDQRSWAVVCSDRVSIRYPPHRSRQVHEWNHHNWPILSHPHSVDHSSHRAHYQHYFKGTLLDYLSKWVDSHRSQETQSTQLAKALVHHTTLYTTNQHGNFTCIAPKSVCKLSNEL